MEELKLLESTLVSGLAASRSVLKVGPFGIYWTPDDPSPWSNYAVPFANACSADIGELCRAFESLDRTPRLEYIHDLHKGLWPLLCEAGFAQELVAPLMILPRSAWAPSEAAGARLAQAHEAEALHSVTDVAFESEPSEAHIRTTRNAIEAGRYLASLVHVGGAPVAAGFAVGDERVREIAGIATLSEYRRQGHAAAVIRMLLNTFFASGGEVAWLTPGDAGAESLYTKLGFIPKATQHNASKAS